MTHCTPMGACCSTVGGRHSGGIPKGDIFGLRPDEERVSQFWVHHHVFWERSEQLWFRQKFWFFFSFPHLAVNFEASMQNWQNCTIWQQLVRATYTQPVYALQWVRAVLPCSYHVFTYIGIPNALRATPFIILFFFPFTYLPAPPITDCYRARGEWW